MTIKIKVNKSIIFIRSDEFIIQVKGLIGIVYSFINYNIVIYDKDQSFA